jgi:hypothetical protein
MMCKQTLFLLTLIIGTIVAGTHNAYCDSTTATPSMLEIQDEYTYIVKKINAAMDEFLLECPSLGLKKPDVLVGKASTTTTTTNTDSSNSGSNSNSGSSTNSNNNQTDSVETTTETDDTIVFQL